MELRLTLEEEEFFVLLSTVEELQETMEIFLENSKDDKTVDVKEREQYEHTLTILKEIKLKLKLCEKIKD